MIRYRKRFSIVNTYENWFEYKYSFSQLFLLNTYWHVKKQDKPAPPLVKNISHTIELDLLQPDDSIQSGFSKQIRQQYKIAENEGITCMFNPGLDEFIAFFNEFAAIKNTRNVGKLNRALLEEIGDQIVLCFAMYNGQPLAAHSYLVDKNIGIVRHQHSATKRFDENFDRNLIGRANKYLTVKNILHFKQQGLQVFDFGGYAANTTDESLLGINKYKLLFGGTVVESVNYSSYPQWILKKVMNLVR
jgi:hypothetical protein